MTTTNIQRTKGTPLSYCSKGPIPHPSNWKTDIKVDILQNKQYFVCSEQSKVLTSNTFYLPVAESNAKIY